MSDLLFCLKIHFMFFGCSAWSNNENMYWCLQKITNWMVISEEKPLNYYRNKLNINFILKSRSFPYSSSHQILTNYGLQFQPWKSKLPASHTSSLFREDLNTHVGLTFIFTDGSKLNDAAGCAAIIGQSEYSGKLLNFFI